MLRFREGQTRDTFTVTCAQVVIYNHIRALRASCLLQEMLCVLELLWCNAVRGLLVPKTSGFQVCDSGLRERS